MRFTLRLLLLSLALTGALLAASPPSAQAQTAEFSPAQRDEIVAIMRDALKRDPSILRDAVMALQQEDSRAEAAAHAGLLAQLAPELLHKAGDPVGGNPNGAVTVVEFSDVRCPYCRRMLPVLAHLLQANKDVRLVYKDLPVLGPGSMLGARAELAAQRQDGYEKLHMALMTGTSNITEDTVKAAAAKAGLDWARLQADMRAPDVQARIDANLALAHQLQLQGTPAYVVGNALLPGAVDPAELQEAVDAARHMN
jgi:protein-disulfide isomerase